jgi:hypothetical protein
MLCAKLQHMCSVVVDKGNGVKQRHRKSFWKWLFTISAPHSCVCGLCHT